MTEITSG